MIPFRDTLVVQKTPYVTWGLLLINGLVFGYFQTLSDGEMFALFQHYGLVPARYSNPMWALITKTSADNYWPFVLNLFMHSSWMHLIMNMWMLWIFGDDIEDVMGRMRFLLFYFMCGVGANLVVYIVASTSPVPVIGASGALAGILGAYIFLFPYAKIVVWIPLFFLPIFIEIPAIAFLGVWVIFQLNDATTTFSSEHATSLAWVGHLAGFFIGAVIFRLFVNVQQHNHSNNVDNSHFESE
ncbi:MAG TPA: rhomboid family intramembrane serine protease [Crenotrichaceae bacterium]|nr:rhomboid family intramembrane serine protease [Crenotrichaceae bacterium]